MTLFRSIRYSPRLTRCCGLSSSGPVLPPMVNGPAGISTISAWILASEAAIAAGGINKAKNSEQIRLTMGLFKKSQSKGDETIAILCKRHFGRKRCPGARLPKYDAQWPQIVTLTSLPRAVLTDLRTMASEICRKLAVARYLHIRALFLDAENDVIDNSKRPKIA